MKKYIKFEENNYVEVTWGKEITEQIMEAMRQLGLNPEIIEMDVEAKRKYQPPKCPNCGKPIEKILFNDYTTYHWNYDEGRYERGTDGEAEEICGNCENKLRDKVYIDFSYHRKL